MLKRADASEWKAAAEFERHALKLNPRRHVFLDAQQRLRGVKPHC